ncbi:MAG TPA: FliH/SctL family protein [Terriglobales bacterium]|nr:FliH/SctL family protein [Terriglobales bacterium]
MSSLSDKSPSPLIIQDVEAFLYEDTSGQPAAAHEHSIKMSAVSSKAAKAEDVPRISELEMARIVSESRAEGLREGEKNAKSALEAEAAEGRKKLAQSLSEFQREREEYYSKVETELVRLALSIAAKILHREAQVDPMLIAGIVKVAVEKLKQNTKISVRVRAEDVAKWREYFNARPGVQIVEDPTLKPMECVLETEVGSAAMGIDTQLQEIEKGFFDLLAQRPATK